MLPARDGQLECRVISQSGDEHLVRLLTWVEGEPLAGSSPAPTLVRQMGENLALLDLALASFKGEAPKQKLLWDLQNAGDLSALCEHVKDEGLRHIVTRRLENFACNLLPTMRGMRRQLIYNDLNPSNVLVDPEHAGQLAGIIDFGDMVEAPLVLDLAVACAYLVEPGGENALGALPAFIRAYHQVNPLQDIELEILGDLIALRHVQTVVITHWRSSVHPENSGYILRNEPRATTALRLFEKLPPGDLTAIIMNACAEKGAKKP
jgi:Ser/Thr protein kinase RdoA (MazF antagonist)